VSNQSIHEPTERAFGWWGHLVYRHRWLAIAALTAATLLAGAWLPQLQVDNSTEAMLLPDDPARLLYDEFREDFGQDDRTLIAIEPREIFELGFLQRLRDFHRDLENEVPHVDEITSLWNARNTRGEGEELIVEDLLEDFPETAADLAQVRDRVLSNPLYTDILISKTGKLTTITVKPLVYSGSVPEDQALLGFDEDLADRSPAPRLLTEAETTEHVNALQAVVDRYRAPDFQLHLAGQLLEDYRTMQALQGDVQLFLVGSSLVMIFLLFLLFRRFSGVLLPMVVVLFSLTTTFGLMVLLDLPAAVPTALIPTLLLAVGVCSAIHLLAIIYREMAEGCGKEEAIARALQHSGLPVLMASLTTAAGLLSFIVTEMAPIARLGIIAPIGIMLTFLYSVILLPALFAVSPLSPLGRKYRSPTEGFFGTLLAAMGNVATGHPRLVLGGALVVLIGVGSGMTSLRFSQHPLEMFPEDSPYRLDAEYLNDQLAGISTLEVLIDTQRENGLHDPAVLRRIEAAMHYAEHFNNGHVSVGKATSIVNVVKETNRALNENRTSHYLIPQDRKLVAQELLLFENSGTDDLEEIVDTQFREARMTLQLPLQDAVVYPEFVAQIGAGFRQILGPELTIRMTGLTPLLSRMMANLARSMATSYSSALVVGRGLLSMLPNLMPITLTLGLMGWLDIPLDPSTLIIGGIIIGLSVDDTIHFMHKFHHYYDKSGNVRDAVNETLTTTGSALLFTSLVLASGFIVMLWGYMRPAVDFGILASTSTLIAFLANVLVAPALMGLVYRTKPPEPSPTA
jgi:predicted RND superfamily exporter protein